MHSFFRGVVACSALSSRIWSSPIKSVKELKDKGVSSNSWLARAAAKSIPCSSQKLWNYLGRPSVDVEKQKIRFDDLQAYHYRETKAALSTLENF